MRIANTVSSARPPARRILPTALMVLTAAAFGLALAGEASAQMFERPWSFKSRDRASLAVVMKQVEEGMFSRRSENSAAGNGGAVGGFNSSTLLLCGGSGGDASATANSSCIILNNATGDLTIGQDAVGDQGASAASETNTTVAEKVEQILDSGDGDGGTGTAE